MPPCSALTNVSSSPPSQFCLDASSDCQLSQVRSASAHVDTQPDQSFNHQLPSSSYFSSSLISREINHLKDELRSLKVDIANMNTLPSQLQHQFGQELKSIKEIFHLQVRLHEVLNPVQIPPSQTDPSQVARSAKDRNLMVSTWNCRGLQNATPYLHQLITDGSDIIAINEHWPDFDGHGTSDHRLNEHSELVHGCGGVSIIWRIPPSVSHYQHILRSNMCYSCLTFPTISHLWINIAPYHLCIPSKL